MNISMGSDESIENQLKSAADRARYHIIHCNWEGARVDMEHASRLDAELRTRKNERNHAARNAARNVSAQVRP